MSAATTSTADGAATGFARNTQQTNRRRGYWQRNNKPRNFQYRKKQQPTVADISATIKPDQPADRQYTSNVTDNGHDFVAPQTPAASSSVTVSSATSATSTAAPQVQPANHANQRQQRKRNKRHQQHQSAGDQHQQSDHLSQVGETDDADISLTPSTTNADLAISRPPSAHHTPHNSHHLLQPIQRSSPAARKKRHDHRHVDQSGQPPQGVHHTQHSSTPSLSTIDPVQTIVDPIIIELHKQVAQLQAELDKYKSLAQLTSAPVQAVDIAERSASVPVNKAELVTATVLHSLATSQSRSRSVSDSSDTPINALLSPYAYLLTPPDAHRPVTNDDYAAMNSGASSSSDDGSTDDEQDDADDDEEDDSNDDSEIASDEDQSDVDSADEAERNADDTVEDINNAGTDDSLLFSDSQIRPDALSEVESVASEELSELSSTHDTSAASPYRLQHKQAWAGNDSKLSSPGSATRQRFSAAKKPAHEDSIISSIVAAFASQAAITPSELQAQIEQQNQHLLNDEENSDDADAEASPMAGQPQHAEDIDQQDYEVLNHHSTVTRSHSPDALRNLLRLSSPKQPHNQANDLKYDVEAAESSQHHKHVFKVLSNNDEEEDDADDGSVHSHQTSDDVSDPQSESDQASDLDAASADESDAEVDDDADDSAVGDAESGADALSHYSSSQSQHSVPNSDWCDGFPYEANLFLLSRCYEIVNRVYTCKDAVTFRAVSRTTGHLVCIKMSDDYSETRTFDPKEVRLLSRVQGHQRICTLEAWHPLPETSCYAIVMRWVQSTPVERCLFGNLQKIRQYMYDLLTGLGYMHQRGVLYRDIKPSNVLWNDDEQTATYIDFDVATFYDAKRLHRSIVGTDGYMAPELVLLDNAKRDRQKPLPIEGYGLEADIYSAGVVFGSLLFEINEDEVADLNNLHAKGDAYIARVLCINDDSFASADHNYMSLHPPHLQNAYNLLCRLLDPDPESRCAVEEALQHPFFVVEGAEYMRYD